MLDAQAAVVAVVGGRASNPVKVTEGPTEAIRAIEVVSHSAVKDRTRAANQFHSLVVTAPVMLRESLRNLSLVQQLRRARRFRSYDDVVEHHARQALKALLVGLVSSNEASHTTPPSPTNNTTGSPNNPIDI